MIMVGIQITANAQHWRIDMPGNYDHCFEWIECESCGENYILEDFVDEGMDPPEEETCYRCYKKRLAKLGQKK